VLVGEVLFYIFSSYLFYCLACFFASFCLFLHVAAARLPARLDKRVRFSRWASVLSAAPPVPPAALLLLYAMQVRVPTRSGHSCCTFAIAQRGWHLHAEPAASIPQAMEADPDNMQGTNSSLAAACTWHVSHCHALWEMVAR
jgi:hypothetical protein